MKRTLTLLIAIILLVSLLIPTAGATESSEEWDSTYVNGSIRSTIGASEDATVFRIFSFNPITDFSDNTDIDNIITASNKIYSIIVVTQDNETFEYWERSELPPTYFSKTYETDRTALDFYLNADLTEYLGTDTVINSVYFLSSDYNNTHTHLGTAIYYRTNKGDYVYFNQEHISPCLFSAKAFSAYMNLVKLMHTEGPKGRIYYESVRFDVWDLSAYKLGSPFFNPDANTIPRFRINPWFVITIALAVLVIAVILVLVVFYRKKIKDHNPYEDHNGTNFDPDFVIAHTVNDHAYDPENLPVNPN